jgi:putative hydrolase of the HAD superfamily
MLISLKQEGFKVGLVSNSGRRLVEKILVALQLDPAVFSAIITSSDVRPKPSAEPYLLALRLMHCKRENSVYVGDRDEAELHPAKELGIRTVLIDRVGDAPSRWADVTVSDLSEIPKALRRIFPT